MMSEVHMVERNGQTKSPVHIHLTGEAPVHVHLKKPKRIGRSKATVGPKSTLNRQLFSGTTHRSNVLSTNRSDSHGGKSLRSSLSRPRSSNAGLKYSRQGSIVRFNGTSPRGSGNLRRLNSHSDFETDDVGRELNKVGNYEQHLEGKKSDCGFLKAVVERQKARRHNSERNDRLAASVKALEDREDELHEYRQELRATNAVGKKLSRSMEALNRSDISISSDSGLNDKLQRKLYDVEMEAKAFAKQISALSDTVKLLNKDQRLANEDSMMLMKHKDLLDERLARFNSNSSGLRTLLNCQQDQDGALLRLTEQRDRLLARLSHSQEAHQIAMSQLLEKEHENVNMRIQMDAQKEENVSVSNIQSALSVTKAHLQKQLRQKDGDCNRLAVQIRTLESQLAQERIDVEHLRGLLTQAKSKPDEDKEALKKATRIQKIRAIKSQDALEEMKQSVAERETVMQEQRIEMNTLRSENTKMSKEKAQALAEVSALKIRISELEGAMDSQDDHSRHQVATVTTKLQEKSGEMAALRLDNDRLRTSCNSAEKRLSQKEAELADLRIHLREYQARAEENHKQMIQSRREVDESVARLDAHRRSTGNVRSKQDGRLAEIRKGSRQTERLSPWRDRGTSKSPDDSRSLIFKLDMCEKKLASLEDENRELVSINARREESLAAANMRLEEKLSDNEGLQRQLETTTTELRRLRENEHDRTSATDRLLQNKVIELESQLIQSRTEVSRLQRERDEIERKNSTEIYNLKDRLEQSHSTNRSMQSYVQFVKNTYASAFDDAALVPFTTTATPAAQRTSLY